MVVCVAGGGIAAASTAIGVVVSDVKVVLIVVVGAVVVVVVVGGGGCVGCNVVTGCGIVDVGLYDYGVDDVAVVVVSGVDVGVAGVADACVTVIRCAVGAVCYVIIHAVARVGVVVYVDICHVVVTTCGVRVTGDTATAVDIADDGLRC